MKSPVITVIGSLSFACGCLMVAASVDKLSSAEILSAGTATYFGFDCSPTSQLAWRQFFHCLVAWWPVVALVQATTSIALILWQRPKTALLLASLPVLSIGYSICRLPRPGELDLVHRVGRGNVQFTATVVEKRGRSRLIVEPIALIFPSSDKLDGRTELVLCGKPGNSKDFEEGQILQVLGKVYYLPPSAVSWRGNQSLMLSSQAVASRTYAGRSQVKRVELSNPTENKSNGWNDFWSYARDKILSAHRANLGGDRGDFLSSIVLGDRIVSLSDQIKTTFRTVGLSHLLAASGFNLSIVVGTTYLLCRLACAPALLTMSISFLSIISFVSLAGPSPSVVRAAIMCSMLLFARLFFRTLHAPAALSFTLLLALFLNPFSIADVGLQLSYLATAGIICGAKPLSDLFVAFKTGRVQKWFIDVVSVIVMAQLSVFPLQLLYFRGIGLMFLPANLLVDPVVAGITLLGFVSSLLALLSFLPLGFDPLLLAKPVDWLVSPGLDYMLFVASTLATWQGPPVNLGTPMPFALAIYFLCFAFFLWSLQVPTFRNLGLTVMAAGFALILYRPSPTNEIVCLSNEGVFSIFHRQAIVYRPDWPDASSPDSDSGGNRHVKPKSDDWQRKKILAHAGINKSVVESGIAHGVQAVHFIRLHDAWLVARVSPKAAEYRPLTTAQMKTVLALLERSDDESVQSDPPGQIVRPADGLPIIVWVQGRYSKLNYYRHSKIYIARASWQDPLLIVKAESADDPFHRLARSIELHPFAELRKVHELSVLR